MSLTRILLADDHQLIRAGLRAMVDSFEGFRVIAEASDGREATRLVRQLKPEIAIIDISMPQLNGLDATAQIMREVPSTKVIILTMHSADQFALQAFRIGAAGYLAKNAAPLDLENALRTIQRGERWFDSMATRTIFDDYRRLANGQAPTSPTSNPDSLTLRQREVLQLIAEGYSTQEIARRLFISAKTVETHRARIMERLNIYDVAGLTRAAIRMNLITSES
ncbi:MAG: hypothetical protein QG599_71 [Pseudomonadota bacterium]|nr:hypothetical protein [Pseudomonadota bacterium]